MSEIMRSQKYGARVEGVDVVLFAGNGELRMEYNVALNLAAFLYDAAKQAKSAAGDHSVRVIGLARLTDANLDEIKAERSRDGTAVFAKAPG
jgi:hypothetical protein